MNDPKPSPYLFNRLKEDVNSFVYSGNLDDFINQENHAESIKEELLMKPESQIKGIVKG